MKMVRLAGLSLDSLAEQPVLLFVSAEETVDEPVRALPIWIGQAEATSILMALQGIEAPRPMTHDLLRSVIETLGCGIDRVEITRLESSTFYANLVLSSAEGEIAIDARPSDSVAVAVRVGCPIFVDESVFDEASIEVSMASEQDEEEEVQRFREFLDHVEPSDFQS